jgi:hypothetical protein
LEEKVRLKLYKIAKQMRTRKPHYNPSTSRSSSNMSTHSDTDNARRELAAEIAAIEEQKAKNLQLDDSRSSRGDDEGVEEEEEEDEGEQGPPLDGAAQLKATILLSKNLNKSVKSMTTCFKRKMRDDALVAAAFKHPEKRTKEADKEKYTGKSAKPSPFAYVAGEAPQTAASSSEGNSHKNPYKYSKKEKLFNIQLRILRNLGT